MHNRTVCELALHETTPSETYHVHDGAGTLRSADEESTIAAEIITSLI